MTLKTTLLDFVNTGALTIIMRQSLQIQGIMMPYLKL